MYGSGHIHKESQWTTCLYCCQSSPCLASLTLHSAGVSWHSSSHITCCSKEGGPILIKSHSNCECGLSRLWPLNEFVQQVNWRSRGGACTCTCTVRWYHTHTQYQGLQSLVPAVFYKPVVCEHKRETLSIIWNTERGSWYCISMLLCLLLYYRTSWSSTMANTIDIAALHWS